MRGKGPPASFGSPSLSQERPSEEEATRGTLAINVPRVVPDPQELRPPEGQVLGRFNRKRKRQGETQQETDRSHSPVPQLRISRSSSAGQVFEARPFLHDSMD